ncbi:MAG: LysR family transcriptional regulator [Burkholderiaceae bacterium]|jgi:DNA-binding transcriptional LysR family regulator|nr:LysR family transcriptional regulator [Burkholderiaceae bacterium]
MKLPDNRIRNVTLRQLQIFSVAAQHLNFARASEDLHLTQPAVWMQVKQLEDLVGLPLFEKIGRKLYLTSAGDEMRQTAATILAEIRRTEERIALLAGGRGGTIALAVVSTGKYFVPRLLALFRQQEPEVQVNLTVANRDQLVQMLARNEVDLCVMGRPPAELDTVAEVFAPHPHVVIASPEHPLARQRGVTAQQLANETLLLREPGSGSRTVMEGYFAAHRIEPRHTMMLGSSETIKQAVMANMGLAFISLHTLALELRTGDIALVDVPGTPLMRDWHVVRLSNKKLSPSAEALNGFIVEHAGPWLETTFDPWLKKPNGA